MALEAREREKEREHPTASSVLPRPATRGVERSWSPHETNPTVGKRRSRDAANEGAAEMAAAEMAAAPDASEGAEPKPH